MQKFLTTPLASFLKVFLVAVLTLVVQKGSIYGLDWANILDVAVLSCIPMVINYLNPEYKGY